MWGIWMKMVIKSKFYILIIIVLILSGVYGYIYINCNPMQAKMLDFFEKNYHDDRLKFSINKFTEFNWDKLFIFNASFEPSDINKIVGITYENYQSMNLAGWKMVFLYQGSIVEVYQTSINDSELPNKYIGFHFTEYNSNQFQYIEIDQNQDFFEVYREYTSQNNYSYKIRPLHVKPKILDF